MDFDMYAWDSSKTQLEFFSQPKNILPSVPTIFSAEITISHDTKSTDIAEKGLHIDS